MHRSPPRAFSVDNQRLAVLKAELAELDHILPTSLHNHGSPLRRSPDGRPSPHRMEILSDLRTPSSSGLFKPYISLSTRRRTDKTIDESLADGMLKRYLGYAPMRKMDAFQRTPTSSPPRDLMSLGEHRNGSIPRGADQIRLRFESRIGRSPRSSSPRQRYVTALTNDRTIDDGHLTTERDMKMQTMLTTQIHNNDCAKQAALLLRHSLATPTSQSSVDHVLAAQSALDLLEEIDSDEVLHDFDERLRSRLEDLEQAKARVREARSIYEQTSLGEREDVVADMLSKHEAAAVASEGVRKEHMRKILSQTRQLCDKQTEVARLEELLKQKGEQLRASHNTLAHTTSQLAAVADTTKEIQKLQEEKQEMNNLLCERNDEVTARDRKIKHMTQELGALKVSAERLRNAEHRCGELSEQCASASAEVQNLRATFEEHVSQIDQLQQALHSKSEALDQVRSQAKELERQHDSLSRENDASRRKYLEVKVAFDETSMQLSKAERELIESTSSGVKSKEQLQASISEARDLSRKVKDLAHQLESSTLELSTLRRHFEGIKAENSSLREASKMQQDERIRTERELSSQNADLNNLKQQNDDLTKRVREKEFLEATQQEDIFRKDTQTEHLMRELRERTSDQERQQREYNIRDAEAKKREATQAEREAMLHSMEAELISKRQELGHTAVNNTIYSSKIAELTQLLEGKEIELAEVKSENIILAEKLRSLEVDHEEDIQKRIQLEQVVELVREQLSENTVQFGALTDDLQATRARLDVEISQRDVLEEQMQFLSSTNAALAVQNKDLESEKNRLFSITTKDAALAHARVEHDLDVADFRQQMCSRALLFSPTGH